MANPRAKVHASAAAALDGLLPDGMRIAAGGLGGFFSTRGAAPAAASISCSARSMSVSYATCKGSPSRISRFARVWFRTIVVTSVSFGTTASTPSRLRTTT